MKKLLDLSTIPDGKRYEPSPVETLRWGTIFGAWGDAIVALGRFRELVGRGGVIYLGRDRQLAEWIGLQDGVTEVRSVIFDTKDEYLDAYRWFCEEPAGIPDTALQRVCDRAGVSIERVTRTHIDYETTIRRRVHHWHGARLPKLAWDWATTIAEEIRQPFVLFQPFSFQSSGHGDHWDGWDTALEVLAGYTPYRVALLGIGYAVDGRSANVHDLIDMAPSMAAVFALAHRAAGIVTTSNSLSHYCVVAGLPALVMGNKQVSQRENIYRAFLQRDGIELLDYDADGGDFLQAVARHLRLR